MEFFEAAELSHELMAGPSKIAKHMMSK